MSFDCVVFFFNATATTEIYTLSLHDALPICSAEARSAGAQARRIEGAAVAREARRIPRVRTGLRAVGAPGCRGDRKSTRLNSSHVRISYAVFCLKKKTTNCHYNQPITTCTNI